MSLTRYLLLLQLPASSRSYSESGELRGGRPRQSCQMSLAALRVLDRFLATSANERLHCDTVLIYSTSRGSNKRRPFAMWATFRLRFVEAQVSDQRAVFFQDAHAGVVARGNEKGTDLGGVE